ncbi:MAG: 16S rRNA (guanine(966)-N(2))-methyltransferase RsmD [Betaproteobacteria bacterium]|nr:MAG: 16S rRNA (guanine(966)-N(2))-methyltransferase RsmD [Betaproteobacteria bacterium]
MPTHKNQLRIIGGTHKRRIIKFADAEGLRPTPDRVRETLFNWLGQDLTGKRCLDAFSGSGAMAFEAASRNASQVMAIESSRKVADAISQNQRLLALNNLKLVNGDAFAFMTATTERFDVIFLDPPFAQDWWKRLAPLVERIAQPGAMIYCEYASELIEFGTFTRLKQGRAGMVHYHLFANENYSTGES